MTPALVNTPVFETDRLNLRAARAADWPVFADFFLSDRAAFVTPPQPTRAVAWRSFGHHLGHWALRGYGPLVFCVKGSDRALGATGPWGPEGYDPPDMAWWLWDGAAEGKGYVREAAEAARAYARALGISPLISRIDDDNTRSAALAQRLGAVPDAAPVTEMGFTFRIWRHPAGPAAPLPATARPALVNTPVIETERLILRAARLADFEPFLAFGLSDRARFVRPADYDRETAWRGFGHMVGHWLLRGFSQFVVEERATGRAIGTVGPWYPDGWPEPEIGWTIWADDLEGRGYATEAAQAARRFAYDTFGWRTAVSYIHPDNARSIALARRLGAVEDSAAAHPGTEPCLVFRHPRPEDLQ